MAAKCATKAFSTTCTVHIENCESWLLSSCCGSVAEYWWLKPESRPLTLPQHHDIVELLETTKSSKPKVYQLVKLGSIELVEIGACAQLAARICSAQHSKGSGGMLPQENFFILDFKMLQTFPPQIVNFPSKDSYPSVWVQSSLALYPWLTATQPAGCSSFLTPPPSPPIQALPAYHFTQTQ